MTLLNQSLLYSLLPLLALPLVIHLLNRRFPHLFRFSSVEHIRQSNARRSFLQRWRHLILLALRSLFLLMLLMAFLKPVYDRFATNPQQRGKRHVILVVDHSLSMEYRGEGMSPRERAAVEVDKILDSLDPKDWVNVVLVEQNPVSAFVDFTQNHNEVRRWVRQLPPGPGRGDMRAANALVSRLLTKNSQRAEVYYLSDFQRKNWASADFGGLPPEARLLFVDVGTKRRDNHGVLDARIAPGQLLAGDTVPVDITIGNFSAEPFQDRVTLQLDRRVSVDHEVSIPPWSIGRVTVPLPAGSPGLHQCEIRLPEDGLPADNLFRLTLPVLEKEEILIVSDEPDQAPSSCFYLRAALNPFENQRGSLLPKTVSSRDLSASRLAGVKKVFLTQIQRLGPDRAQLLAKHLFAGGGLVYFLDGPADADNLAAMEAAIGPRSMPLQLTAKQTVADVAAGGQQIVRGDFKSRHLRLFRGAGRQDLGLLEFYAYHRASTTGAGSVLLHFGDESPAMAALGHGFGTLLLLNFSCSEHSSNLARQRIFPAWMQELVKTTGTDEPAPAYTLVGDPLQTEVWKADLQGAAFRSPSGRTVTVQRDFQGERCRVSFTPQEAGFYLLGEPKPVSALAVNSSPDESDLRAMEHDQLPVQTVGTQDARFLGGSMDYETVNRGQPLFHYFLLAATLFLLFEAAVQVLVRKESA